MSAATAKLSKPATAIVGDTKTAHNTVAKKAKSVLTVSQWVDKLLKAHKVVFFSKSFCPFCKRAKAGFERYSIPVFVVDLDCYKYEVDAEELPFGESQVLDEMQKRTEKRTVPRIFLNGKFFSDSDGLFANQEAKLKALAREFAK